MSVYEVDQPQLDELERLEGCRALWAMRSERAWYVDNAGVVSGTVFGDDDTRGWGFAVCRADERGNFRCVCLKHGLPSEGNARTKLLSEMRRLTQAGDSTVKR
jgi:hypothetical protein